MVDLDGNATVKAWFKPEATQSLIVDISIEVETHRNNPFEYLLDPWAVRLPLDYPGSLLQQLQPYLQGQQTIGNGALDPIAVQLGQEIAHQVEGYVTNFLATLNQKIYQSCSYLVRETGAPLPAGITWSQRRGSCRDLTVLFIETCRAVGLAARFVSGYQEGDLNSSERHLHAWAEVYLPGAGWRGYDPTQGLAVADRHIALSASPLPQYTAPITGAFTPSAIQSTMTYHLSIDRGTPPDLL